MASKMALTFKRGPIVEEEGFSNGQLATKQASSFFNPDAAYSMASQQSGQIVPTSGYSGQFFVPQATESDRYTVEKARLADKLMLHELERQAQKAEKAKKAAATAAKGAEELRSHLVHAEKKVQEVTANSNLLLEQTLARNAELETQVESLEAQLREYIKRVGAIKNICKFGNDCTRDGCTFTHIKRGQAPKKQERSKQGTIRLREKEEPRPEIEDLKSLLASKHDQQSDDESSSEEDEKTKQD